MLPVGKHGDVLVLFCGQSAGTGTILVQALVGGVAANPGAWLLLGTSGTTEDESRCANFYKPNVTAGTKAVNMQRQTSSGPPMLWVPSMIVILNIH